MCFRNIYVVKVIFDSSYVMIKKARSNSLPIMNVSTHVPISVPIPTYMIPSYHYRSSLSLSVYVGYNLHLGSGMHWRESGNSSTTLKHSSKWHWKRLWTKWFSWDFWDAFCGVNGLWWLQVCEANNWPIEWILWKHCKFTIVIVSFFLWNLVLSFCC